MADITYVTNILTGTGTVEERLDALEAQVNLNTLAIESIVNTLQSLITGTQFTQLSNTVNDVQTLVTTLESTVNDIVTNGVAARLSELKDVEISNLLANDVITYNGTKFVNSPMAEVSGVGNWDTILNKPSTFPSDWNTMVNKPASATATWDTLAGKPTYFPTAWDGGYIANKPSVFPPAAHEHDAVYVKKVGDTMTGPLVINYTAGTALTSNGTTILVGSGNNIFTVNATETKTTGPLWSAQEVAAYAVGAGATTPSNGKNYLWELNDVRITGTPSNGQGLVYDSSISMWTNKEVQTSGGTATSIQWSAILNKPSAFPTTWDLITGTAPTIFDSRYILKAGDTVTGLITFNAGITVNNGAVVFKVESTGVNATGNIKATGEITAYKVSA